MGLAARRVIRLSVVVAVTSLTFGVSAAQQAAADPASALSVAHGACSSGAPCTTSVPHRSEGYLHSDPAASEDRASARIRGPWHERGEFASLPGEAARTPHRTLAQSEADGTGSASDAGAFWAAGLDGTGQVVGISDSGVDAAHCALRDEAVAFDGFQLDESFVPEFVSEQHRKLALYYMFVDGQDATGQGTHAAAVVAGNPPGGRGSRGAAYGARIAVFDIGADADARAAVNHVDHVNRVWARLFGAGARVQTASWTQREMHYNQACRTVDAFSHGHENFLAVLPAGVAASGQERRTVAVPALAKNSLAVGSVAPHSAVSTSTAGGPTGQGPVAEVETLQFRLLEHVFRPIRAAYMVAAGGADDWTDLEDDTPLVLGAPEQGCSHLHNQNSMRGAVVLVSAGGCSIEAKVLHAQLAGAGAVLVASRDGVIRPLSVGTSGGIEVDSDGRELPVGRIGLPTFELLRTLLRAGVRIGVHHAGAHELAAVAGEESVDPRSAVGPAPRSGRIKPDVVARGTVEGALAGTDCDYGLGEAAEAAAPLVAGLAAIVRQYFADGFYPHGVAASGPSHDASGALVKAVLVGGAQRLAGYVDGQARLPGDAPSSAAGWGRVELARSLPLKDAAYVQRLQVADKMLLESEGAVHTFCVAATGGPLTVTLAWHDPPGAQSQADALLHDLDLEVELLALGAVVLHSRGASEADRVNTVERVQLDDAPAGKVLIRVNAARLAVPQAHYALVVQGNFSGSLQDAANPDGEAGGGSLEECGAASAVLTSTPELLVGSRNVSFGFEASGSEAGEPAAFECSLTSTSEAQLQQLHTWQPCSGPHHQQYVGLMNGRYLFQVRANQTRFPAHHQFKVDATAPVVRLFPFFGYPEGHAFARPLPQARSSQQVAAFAFTADDSSDVTTSCRLSSASTSAGGVDNVRHATPEPVQLNTVYEACTSPQVFAFHSTGNYTFEVWARDAAGNTGRPAARTFIIEFAAGTVTTWLRRAPGGRSSSLETEVELVAYEGSSSGAGTEVQPAALGGVFKVSPGSFGEKDKDHSWDDQAWADIPAPTFKWKTPHAGAHGLRVSARVPSLQAVSTTWNVSVDTRVPKVSWAVRPPTVLRDDRLVAVVAVDDAADTLECHLLPQPRRDLAAIAPLLQPCNVSSSGLLEGRLFEGLVDGASYTLGLRAVSAAGAASPVLDSSFKVDRSDPLMSSSHSLYNTRAEEQTLLFNVVAGPGSNGLQRVDCGTRWLGAGPAATVHWAPCKQVCNGCAEYRHTVTMDREGRWGVLVYARDSAGNAVLVSDMHIVVDRTAPQILALEDVPRGTQPPEVHLTLKTHDDGKYQSTIRGTLCMVSMRDAAAAAAEGPQMTAATVLDTTQSMGSEGGEFLYKSYLNTQQHGALGRWYKCARKVQLTDLPGGELVVYLRAFDDADNVGNVVNATFSVDESKHVTADRSGLGVVGYVLLACGGTLLVCACAAAIWLLAQRRRQRVRRSSHRQVQHEPTLLPALTTDTCMQSSEGSCSHTRKGSSRCGQVSTDLAILEAGLSASKIEARNAAALQLAIQASLTLSESGT